MHDLISNAVTSCLYTVPFPLYSFCEAYFTTDLGKFLKNTAQYILVDLHSYKNIKGMEQINHVFFLN